MKRSVLILLILLCAPWLIYAQSVYQGSCAVGSYSSFPSTGLYGASDSFPQNTLVTVENTQTNQKATVLIIDRLNNNGLFMLLSRDAGKAIGLSPGEVGQVSVTLAKRGGAIARGPGDLPYSTDPDIFPAAGVGNPSSLSFLEKYLNSAGTPLPQGPVSTASPPQAKAPPTLARSTPSTAAPTSGAPGAPAPSVSNLAPQPAPTTGQTTPSKPPTPQLAQAAPTPASGGQQPGTPRPAGPAPQATAPTAPPTSPPSAGPVVTQLSPAEAPRTSAPAITELATPAVPERAGGAPTVSPLQQVTSPQPSSEIASAESPALPEIRNPGPAISSIAQAIPPSNELPTLAMAVPTAPARPANGPQVSELAQASPSAEPFVASVTAVPSIPGPSAVAAAAPTSGPMVSALAGARTPSGAFEVAQSSLPLPSMAGLTPAVSPLASGEPPAQVPTQSTTVPAPQIAQQAAPSTAAAPSQPTAPQQVPSQPKEQAVAQAAVSPSLQISSAAGSVQMVGRIPVRPSTALAPSSYYVQLGVYVDSKAAVALADNLSPDYPVSVYAFQQAKKPLYKVMIGPLNSDESGTLLYLFMAQGYKDAFVRKGE